MPLPHITKAEAEAHNVNLDVPNIAASGSVTGMRQKYGTVWKQGGQLRVGSFVYNVGPDEIHRLWRLGVLKGKRGTPPGQTISDAQRVMVRLYGGGDYRHLETLPYTEADAQARAVDDTLFRFLWIDLSEAEDGGALTVAYNRVEAARGQLEEIANALALITTRKIHKGKVAPLNTDGTMPPGIY